MALSVSLARREFPSLVQRVILDRTEIEIVSNGGSTVLMSKEAYDGLVETSYLLRSPENARGLMAALALLG